MMQPEIYLYGQILMTTSLRLRDGMPPRDGYGELSARYRLIGGETGVGAAVLCALGCSVRLAGTWLGRATRDGVMSYFQDKAADLSLLTYDGTFEGLEDTVLIDGDARTCLGMFGAFQGPEGYRWNRPEAAHLHGCRVAGIDPFFGQASEDAARLCAEAGIPYVTIDCAPDSRIARDAAVVALSGEYLREAFPGETRETILQAYLQRCRGLIILTAGGGDLLYGRPGTPPVRQAAYRVKPESTLGAGDTFKAACVYALLKHMTDAETVGFASACAAAAIMKFPIPLHPPTLERVRAVQAAQAERA